MLGQTLQDIRKQQGISQSTLAKDSSTFQANISEIENGLVSPSFQTAELLFSHLGYRLLPIAYKGLTVQEWGSEINNALEAKNEKRAFRLFLQINDDLGLLEPAILLTITATPPRIDDFHYSSLVEALVEWHLSRRRLQLPTWINLDASKLPEPWFVDSNESNKAKVRQKTPAAFAKRHIYLSESELQSA